MNARDELQSLVNDNNDHSNQSNTYKHDIKHEMMLALKEKEEQDKQRLEQEELDRKKAEYERQQQLERQDTEETYNIINNTIDREIKDNPEFANLVQKTDIFQDRLFRYCFATTEPPEDEIVGIIDRIAKDENSLKQLQSFKTYAKIRKVLAKARRDFLTGNKKAEPPDMMRKNIPSYTANSNSSGLAEPDLVYEGII